MSLPKNVVSVDLGNLPRPAALDLLDASAGASVVAYADPSGHTRRALPYSASDADGTVVKFYIDADEVWLSAKVNGHEIADAGGTTKHVVANANRFDASPVVQLEWNADRLNQAAPASSGGSTPVSKVLAIRYGTATALTAGVRQYLDPTFFATLDAQEVVGTDLSIQGDGSIVTAAGGQFLMSLWCNFAVSGLAVDEEVNVRLSINSAGMDSGADAIWNVNLPAGTVFGNPPAQAQARCGPCTFPPGASFYGFVTLGPLSQGSVTLEDVEFMVTRIG